jgi:hypothetical protein
MSQKDDAAAAYYADPANRMSDSPGHGLPGRQERLSDHVPIRFDRATIAAIKRFSDDDGMTVSAWVRRVVNREIRRRTSLVTRTGFAGGYPPSIIFDAGPESVPGTAPTVTVVQGLRLAG